MERYRDRRNERHGHHTLKLAAWALVIMLGCARSGRTLPEDTESKLPTDRVLTRENCKAEQPAGAGSVKIAGICNARYVGALPVGTTRHLKPQALLRSADLQMVDEEGYSKLVELGIAAVVDFRTEHEEHHSPDAPWVRRGTRYLNLALPKIEEPSSRAYTTTMTVLEPMLPRLFEHLGAPNALPALFHCNTGRGRSCLGMAIVLLAVGVAPKDVARDFTSNQDIQVDVHWLDGVFERIGRSGGIDAYLESHSVAQADLTSLRRQALD